MTSPPTMKTYGHLAGAERRPSEYEIVTSKLLWYPSLGGFEVRTPIDAWYDRYQRRGALGAVDWDAFVDPQATTYTAYVARARDLEAHLDAVLRAIRDADADRELTAEWRATLGRILPTLRYPCHGLQMIAAYFGQMAPSGRVVICAALQAGDEVRRIQRLAERTAQIRRTYPRFGDDAKHVWEADPAFQPLRRAIEIALVTYDWGEAFVAANLCIKPLFDALVWTELPRIARAANDPWLGVVFASFAEDAQWHRAWTEALVSRALTDPGNRAVLDRWIAKWMPLACAATAALAGVLGSDRADAIARDHAAWLTRAGLEAR